MIKFPKTPRTESIDRKYESYPVVVSEKLDGANAAVSFTPKGEMQLQSRGHILRGGPREAQFSLFKSACAQHEEQLRQLLGSKYVLFGECLYAKNRAFYDNLPSYFVTYDLYDMRSGQFLATDTRQALLKDCPFPEAPILHRTLGKTLGSLWEHLGPSHYKTPRWQARLIEAAQRVGAPDPLPTTDDSILMEGLYVKVEDGDHVVARLKLLRPDFEKVRDDSDWHRRTLIPNRLQCDT